MSDMLKRQMQALESMMYSDDDTTTSGTEGLMGQGASATEPEDYVTSFVKYLRSKRDLDPAKAREEIPAVKARNTSITDEDIAKYEEEMSVFEQAKQSAMEARLQREASGITQSLTEEDVSVRAAVGDPEYGNKLDKDQTIMIDVTDTDEGKLSNEEPLYKMAEEIDPGTIDTDTIDADGGAAPSGKGLMSPRLDSKGETPPSELKTYTTEFSEVYLKEHEGLKSHESLEGGKDTAALGVKFTEGLKREDYDSDAEFAAAVALKHRDKAKDKFTEGEWQKLPESVKYALVDLNYNVGTIGSTAKKSTTVDKMKNTLEFVGMTTKAKEKVSLISLAKRRAWNWNKTADDIGEKAIAKIKQTPTSSGGTKFEYLDKDDNVIHSFTTSRKAVKLNSKGVATGLTQTREITV
jgi:GH24 family phage-related lysozyme (muramidase)